MNLLVTGGAGFIGSHFVLRHMEQLPKDDTVVLDKLTYAADKEYLRPAMGKITFVEGDIADVELVAKLVEENEIDTIVNFAAESHVDRSIENALPFLQTNILGVQSIIEVCKVNPDVRLLHVSTDEVYGDIGDRDPPCTVSKTLWPSSPYAASKACGDLLLIASMRTFNLKCCITRCTNNFGPHQAKEKLIPKTITNALQGKKVPVYGKGKNKRDWLYVTDHCDALELILKMNWAFLDEGSGHLFNISADDERENIEVVKAVLDFLGKPHDLIEFVKDRPGHDWRYALDSSPIRKLGWKPRVSFEKGMKNTIDWYKERL